MSNNNNHQLGEAPWFHVILSTGFGAGFVPGAPGTAGAFVALVIWYVLYLLLSPIALLITTLALVIVTLVAGAWTSRVMEKYWGEDPRCVVIDEYLGTWIPMLVAPVAGHPVLTACLALTGFAAFRVIDIVKTPLARCIERIGGGWAVMLDDALAGIYALLIVLVVKYCFIL